MREKPCSEYNYTYHQAICVKRNGPSQNRSDYRFLIWKVAGPKIETEPADNSIVCLFLEPRSTFEPVAIVVYYVHTHYHTQSGVCVRVQRMHNTGQIISHTKVCVFFLPKQECEETHNI